MVPANGVPVIAPVPIAGMNVARVCICPLIQPISNIERGRRLGFDPDDTHSNSFPPALRVFQARFLCKVVGLERI
jgi:hypothetical protein